MRLSLDWQRVPKERWSSLAPLLHAWNRRADGGVRCLHADQGDDVSSHAAELAALAPDGAVFWLCREGVEPAGLIGCEFDGVLQRAWLRGPLAARPAVLDEMRGQAMPRLQAALPQVRRWDAFPAADDEPLNAWYRAAGFVPQQLHRVLRALATAPATGGADADVRIATADDAAATWPLHDRLFPSSYLSAAEFRGGTARRTLVVVRAQAGPPIGYLHAEDRPESDEVYVDYLGVDDAHRGRGVGPALLQWAGRRAVERGRRFVVLTVREDRRSALGLYARHGFVELSAGRHWQRGAG